MLSKNGLKEMLLGIALIVVLTLVCARKGGDVGTMANPEVAMPVAGAIGLGLLACAVALVGAYFIGRKK